MGLEGKQDLICSKPLLLHAAPQYLFSVPFQLIPWACFRESAEFPNEAYAGRKEVVLQHRQEKKRFEKFEKNLFKLKNLPASTLDGKEIELAANIELPADVPSVLAHGAKGIGLYRTEYIYMNRKSPD